MLNVREVGWAALPALAIVLFAAAAGWHGFLPAVTWKPFTPTTLSSSLVPLLVVAVLIERTLEVFFGIWREPRRRELEQKAELATRAINLVVGGGQHTAPLAAAESTAAARLAPPTTEQSAEVPAWSAPAVVVERAVLDLATAEQELAQRESETTRLAFLAGGALGVIVALSGVRLLEAMIVMPPSPAWRFQMVDVVLTGGLLGGGAEGFHRIMNVLTAFLKTTEKKAEAAAPPKPAGTA